MELQNINAQTSAAFNQKEPEKPNQMGKQQFLQLLVAQMRHQNPINPLDGADFVAQLAQFNSVEQLIDVNSNIKELQHSQEMMSSGLNNSLATSLTGKQVKAISNLVHLPKGESADIQYKLNHSASKVDIVILDEAGNEVRREGFQNVSASDHSWNWDGKDNNGQSLPEGRYHVSVEARNDDDSRVDALTYIEGLATKVRFTAEGVKLTVNGVELPIGDVEEVGLPI